MDGPKPAHPVKLVVVRPRREASGADDVDDLAAALAAELDRARREGEQGVVTATADVGAGVEVGAALADDDLAGLDDLAAEALHTQVLGVGVATVASGRSALLMCHCSRPFLLDAGDLDAGQIGAETLALLVPGLVLELLDDDLRAAEIAEHLGGHGDLRQLLRVGGDRVTVDVQNGGELDGAILARLDSIEDDDRADLDLLLPPTGAHNCVDHVSPLLRNGRKLLASRAGSAQRTPTVEHT